MHSLIMTEIDIGEVIPESRRVMNGAKSFLSHVSY